MPNPIDKHKLVDKYRDMFTNQIRDDESWCRAAQASMGEQCFPVPEAVKSWNNIKKEAAKSSQDRVMQRAPQQGRPMVQTQQSAMKSNNHADKSLAELMAMVKSQQKV